MREQYSSDILEKLPKVDLHLHLDGSLKPETVFDLSIQEGLNLPAKNPNELLSYLQIQDTCTSLKEYLSKFDLVSSLLHTEKALERVAYELVEQAFEKNVQYIEVRFGPQLHRNNGLSLEQIIEAVINGLKRGEKEYGVKTNVIACCLRHHSIAENLEVIEAASSFHGKGLAAVDLAGDEAAFPAHLFREVFQLANKKGVPVTIHAGEAGGPENIYEAVTHLHAARIGHGVRLREDPKVKELILANRIPLEMCPISNIQTKACIDWDDYPIRDYFDNGILITVNTDNLTVSNTDITKELQNLMDKFQFSIEEISKILLNGIEAAFLSSSEKNSLRKKFHEDFLTLGIS
ncbi:adenosine deaminase [Bacillus sp. 03113]|uniref:adenosine deaminase n=1 Tax=Bacillus sp. 03113 TaxID=2578211 RepID=UPI0011419151|nr:adenosine deaminase [Bacillus sp. 03113]